jgi:hypothetical protein
MAANGQTASTEPIHVVSVSLGSSKRNKAVTTEFLGRQVRMERISVGGDYERACQKIAELDGKVSAIGLGGTDLYLVAGGKRYVIEESRRLAQAARVTPVVDGSGLKNTLERETVRWLAEHEEFHLAGKRALLVVAVDRFGMAEGLVAAGCDTIFGDLIFVLGVPIPLRSLRTLGVLAAMLLPILRRLPIRFLYPTGERQESVRPRHARFFEWADIIAGDFHYIRRNLPPRLDGKLVLTNTTTDEDVALLRERGLKTLVTTTPEFQGRSFGTNVMEGVLIALAGKRPEEMQPQDYLDLLAKLRWEPRVEHLSEGT